MRTLWAPFLLVFFSCQTLSHTAHNIQQPNDQPVRSVLDTPVEFTGPRDQSAASSSFDEIRIGLFSPISAESPVGLSMYQGALLAISQFNSAGGLAGIPIRLLQRWDGNPWLGGSKQMTKLVYEDSVWAIIGSVDGATTHIAEQVVTKAWLPLLSPVSADPTLNYIRIPWMFRLPPDDEMQAQILAREGIEAYSLSKIGLITSTDHDGRIFAEEMLEQMAALHQAPAFHIQVSPLHSDLDDVARRADSFAPDGVILRLPVEKTVRLFRSFEEVGFNMPVLIPWIPGLLVVDLEDRFSGDILSLAPFSEMNNSAFAIFERDYRAKYGASPTSSAAYAFDATNLVLESLVGIGLERLSRAGLRQAISDASGYVGVTGTVTWDNAGGNETRPVVRVLRGEGPGN